MDRNRLLQQALQNLSKDLLPKTKGDVAPDRSDSSRASGSGNESSASRDSLLQIPQHSPPSRLRENPRSDWDVPLDRFGDIANHYFEPQGELLHEQRDRRPITNEFSIPTAISSQASGLNSAGIGGFTVSSKPCALQSHPLTGVKRKSGSDLDTTMGCERGLPPLKRQELDTSDMLAESSSDKPPAQSTRSQSANAMRTRSGTDVTDSRPESVRQAEDVSGGPRRGFTEPRLAPMMLPARKVFPIQIGDKLFKLSGASISSDGKHKPIQVDQIDLLTYRKHRLTFPTSSKSSFDRMKALIMCGRSTSIATPRRLRTLHYTCRATTLSHETGHISSNYLRTRNFSAYRG